MQVVLHKRFVKKYIKLSPKLRARFKKRRDLFLKDPNHPTLNNHKLEGALSGTHSINITGDYRVHYMEVNSDTVVFIDIDTHSNLYGK